LEKHYNHYLKLEVSVVNGLDVKQNVLEEKKNKFFTLPNLLSFLRLLLVAPIVFTIFNRNLFAAAFLVIISFCTDVADGRLARFLKQTSEFGRLIDFTADRVNLIALLGSLFVIGVFPWWGLFLIVSRELVMVTYNLYLIKRGLKFTPPTSSGKATFVVFFAMELSFILNVYPLNYAFLVIAFILMPLSLAKSLKLFSKIVKEG
jgi:cardiolipin synthase (CMP-forming)